MNEFESGDADFAADESGAAEAAAAPTDESGVSEAAAATDRELDELEAAFDTVDAALKALDADDLDGAEALAASLEGAGDVPPEEPPSTEG